MTRVRRIFSYLLYHSAAVNFLIAIAGLACWILYHEIYTDGTNDFTAHAEFALGILQKRVTLIHAGLHYLAIATYLAFSWTFPFSFFFWLVLFVCAAYGAIYVILDYYFRKNFGPVFLAFMAACILLATALYIPYLTQYIYSGVGGPSIWHNPTYIAMKPFAIAAFFLGVYVVDNPKTYPKMALMLFSIALVSSTYIKPNFTSTFLPAFALYLIIKYRKEYKLGFAIALAVLPSVLLFFWQWQTLQFYNGGNSVIISVLGVWKFYSQHPLLAILRAVAFSLGILIFRFRHKLGTGFILAWMNCVIATLFVALLAEPVRYTDGNFFWGYSVSLQILFLFSTIEWLKWIKEYRKSGKIPGIFTPLGLVSALFLLHTLSGCIYLVRIIFYNNYS